MGALPKKLFLRYKELYEKVKMFVSKNYGNPAVFEHGIAGQTVFHAHTHFFPFSGKIDDIVPEKDKLKKINFLDQVREEFKKYGKYLYVEVNDDKYLVNIAIGYPRFFRKRFAEKLGAKERGDWKETEKNEELMKIFKVEISKLKVKWKQYNKK